MNLHLENTKQIWIVILVKFKEVMLNSKLCFFAQTGSLVDQKYSVKQ